MRNILLYSTIVKQFAEFPNGDLFIGNIMDLGAAITLTFPYEQE
jgi:hypothetical protein